MSGSASRESRKRALERTKAAEKRRGRRRWLAGGGAGAVVIAAAIAIPLATAGGPANEAAQGPRLAALSTLGTLRPAPPQGAPGAEGVPVPDAAPLASTATAATGRDVDGIGCDTSEQTLFHVHAHLTILVNGTPRQVPAGIGIPGAQPAQTAAGPFVETGECFYWLHTHAPDGIIHIESPVQRGFTLGEFFDEWGQPLGPDQAGPAKGHVTALYNGKVYQGDPRGIPLTAHARIQLEVAVPLVAPAQITFPNGL
jgi:hypothetical protein